MGTSIWREFGDPLVAGAASGPLRGKTVAVKDLFDVAGHAVGAGVPAYLAESPVASGTATAVQVLLDAGASVAGIAQTDEFAYSMAGRNAHYGAPPNGAIPGRLPGGSSSGPASAVAAGQADIGLGTDTGGSVRVPASFQGLWGLRTTHGAVSRSGLLPLAPSFDTVGWLTRDAATLSAAAGVSLDIEAQEAVTPDWVFSPRLLALCTTGVQEAFAGVVERLRPAEVDLGDPNELFEIFRVTQAAEAWAADGAWIDAHPGALGDDIAARFAIAKTVTEQQAIDAAEAFDRARQRLDGILGERVLLLPSASTAAPSATAPAPELDAFRATSLRLTSIAGITGRPGLGVPLLSTPDGPVGLCLVGPRYSDLALIELALQL